MSPKYKAIATYAFGLSGTERGVNPFQNIIDIILSEMCNDCLDDKWRYEDPLFESMFRAYINALIIEYGNEFPIPMKVAQIVLKTGVYEDNLYFKCMGVLLKYDKRHNKSEDTFFMKFN